VAPIEVDGGLVKKTFILVISTKSQKRIFSKISKSCITPSFEIRENN